MVPNIRPNREIRFAGLGCRPEPDLVGRPAVRARFPLPLSVVAEQLGMPDLSYSGYLGNVKFDCAPTRPAIRSRSIARMEFRII